MSYITVGFCSHNKEWFVHSLNIASLVHFIIYNLPSNIKNVENSSLKLSHRNRKKWPAVLQGRNNCVPNSLNMIMKFFLYKNINTTVMIKRKFWDPLASINTTAANILYENLYEHHCCTAWNISYFYNVQTSQFYLYMLSLVSMYTSELQCPYIYNRSRLN